MIGLVLVTHGRLADELRAAMEHVVGAQRNVATVCIGPDDDIETQRREVHRRIAEVETGDGVVLLTDMFGGTPSNLCISQLSRDGVEVIAGVNLPMLIKLAKVRSHRLLADAVECAMAAGRKYITTASHVLPPTLDQGCPEPDVQEPGRAVPAFAEPFSPHSPLPRTELVGAGMLNGRGPRG